MTAPAAVGAEQQRAAEVLDASHLGDRSVQIRDRVLRTRPRALRALQVSATAFDQTYPTGTGESVRVVMSDSYVPDPQVAQSWASFLGGLIHGDEIERVTVFVITPSELAGACGPEALACYGPADEALVVPGERPQDGTPLEEIAAHEYGHHVALNRRNPPWPAIDYGPKRWATYERICSRAEAGEVFPGNQEEHYHLDPGEGFADSYRVVNGGNPDPGAFTPDDSFYPDANDVRKIRADVLDPWSGQNVYSYSGRIGRRGSRSRFFRVVTPLDGNLNFRLSGPPRSDFDLYLYQGGRLVGRSRGRGRFEALLGTNCGGRAFRVEVYRYRGAGRFRLKISKA